MPEINKPTRNVSASRTTPACHQPIADRAAPGAGGNLDELLRALVAAIRLADAQIDPHTGRAGGDHEQQRNASFFIGGLGSGLS